METRNPVGFCMLKIAATYMMAGLILGLVMGVSHSYALVSVHSHIGLLGWLTMAVTGLVYIAVPRCDGNRLAKLHFWVYNLGLPVMVASLAWKEYSSNPRIETVVGIGSILVVLALLIFVVNVFINCKRT